MAINSFFAENYTFAETELGFNFEIGLLQRILFIIPLFLVVAAIGFFVISNDLFFYERIYQVSPFVAIGGIERILNNEDVEYQTRRYSLNRFLRVFSSQVMKFVIAPHSYRIIVQRVEYPGRNALIRIGPYSKKNGQNIHEMTDLLDDALTVVPTFKLEDSLVYERAAAKAYEKEKALYTSFPESVPSMLVKTLAYERDSDPTEPAVYSESDEAGDSLSA